MTNLCEKKYTRDRSNEQKIFIKDARIGWRSLLSDLMKQLGNGIAQYEYLESLGPKLGGQARRLLDNYIDKWDYRDVCNLCYEEAVTCEASRSKWRNFYKAKSVFDLRQIQVAPGGVPAGSTRRPDPRASRIGRISDYHSGDLLGSLRSLP